MFAVAQVRLAFQEISDPRALVRVFAGRRAKRQVLRDERGPDVVDVMSVALPLAFVGPPIVALAMHLMVGYRNVASEVYRVAAPLWLTPPCVVLLVFGSVVARVLRV